jgi:UDP-glucose 4-epimerase
MSRIFITGAGGFIGRHLASSMAARHDVTGLGRSGRPQGFPENAVWIEHDLSLPGLPETMPSAIDVVVHLAQSRRFRDFPDGASDVFGINVRSMFDLALWAQRAGAKKFIFTSTGGLCGTSDRPLTEADPYVGGGRLGLYFATKYSSELLLRSLQPILSHVILRPFFVYGIGQDATMLISRLFEAVKSGSPILLQGRDGIRINPVHVEDCVKAIERAATVSGPHLLNLAGPDVVSLREVGEIIGKCVGRAPIFDVDEAASPGHVVGDIKRITDVLGAPVIRFDDGITAICKADGKALDKDRKIQRI